MSDDRLITAAPKEGDDPEASLERLMEEVTGPDFPTGGVIYGRQGIRDALTTGRGKIIMRGRVTLDTMKNGRDRIIINEIPYQVNKASMIEKIAELVREKRIEGI